MNVVRGTLDGKRFASDGASIPTPVGGTIANAVLGVRPEDCTVVAPAKADLKGEIYTTELIGDHTLVTVKTGHDMLAVKAAKDFTARQGEKAGVSFSTSRLFVFDEATGLRVR
ncbi:MAG: TOBE domain-containing protein [Pseudomonadota bacterium]|nr:TOBE domain-containing protein [Pseudomonadota bacterium]